MRGLPLRGLSILGHAPAKNGHGPVGQQGPPARLVIGKQPRRHGPSGLGFRARKSRGPCKV